MSSDWHPIQTVFTDAVKSVRSVPPLAWVALFLGIGGLLWAAGHPGYGMVPQLPPTHWWERARDLPWWELLREISIAAVLSFFLTLFLDEPLREQTVTKLGRDVAPFLIAALTVPEMRYKMRQICEFGVIRKDARLQLWISEEGADRYILKVQTRSKFCNISNTVQNLTARITVDEETSGKLLALFIRPVNIQGLSEQHWSCDEQSQPAPTDGQLVVEKTLRFPSCDDWQQCYIEITGEYQEKVTMLGGVGKTLFEGYWPMMGLEIECVNLPPDLKLKVKIPYHDDLRQISPNRWTSSVAILPGERVDLVLAKQNTTPVLCATLPTAQPPQVAPVAKPKA